MLIREISLENFGLYRGVNSISLAPRVKYRQKRPVVLIGGQNGSGKTTVLEALRLCLYGPLSLGERVSRREYEEFLRDRIHRSTDAALLPKSASVGLEFEYSTTGQLHTYRVERSWELSGNTVHTFLDIKRDGELLDEVDQSYADDFLRDLVPPGVSQLYFFDGEKIQQLAEAEDDSETLGEAIRGLLGLDLAKQLAIDLKVYARRLDDSPTTAPIKERLGELAKRKRQLQDKSVELLRVADECQSRVDQIKIEIAKTKERIVREGGAFAKKEESLKAQRDQLVESIRQAENELRDLCGELLPFSLAKDLCTSLAKQLKSEQQIQSWQTHKDVLSERINIAADSMDEQLFASLRLGDKTQRQLRERVASLFNGLLAEPEDLPSVPLTHRLSDDERERLTTAVEAVHNRLPKRIKTIEKRLEADTRRLSQVHDKLDKIPPEDQLRPLLDRMGQLNDNLATAQKEMDKSFTDLNRHDSEMAVIDREASKLDHELSDASEGLDRRAMVSKVQSVLDEYSTALASAKAAELTEAVTSRFRQLWRKEQVIEHVEIDPRSYKVTLRDCQGRPVSKKELSAGEKQVYAIAMLWALAEVSGRPLPVVIDTPLARLDSQHRVHLVEHYFPNASHQVVILSTDTEIDEEHFRELSPSISHAYELRFDEQHGCAVLEEGYFWGRRRQELVNATE